MDQDLASSINPTGMTAPECCKQLSTALENGTLLLRKDKGDYETEEDDSAREQAVQAASEFVSIMTSSATERLSYLDAIRSVKFQKHHARRLFSALLPLLTETFDNEHYVPLSAFEDVSSANLNDETAISVRVEDDDYTVVPDEASTQSLLLIKYSAMITHAFLENQLQRRSSTVDRVYDIIEEVYVVAELLHNNLFNLTSCGREGISVQKEVIAMCELYWKGQFSNREEFVNQLIPLLVVRSLNGNATNADIKRLWAVKEAFHLFDFQDKATIGELRNSLLKTTTSALFLKSTEGRKMIAFLFQLDASFVQDLHRSIKIQIPYSKAAVLEAYGDIYLNAWKNVAQDVDDDHDFKEESEEQNDEGNDGIQNAVEDALQDLMFACLHAPSPHLAKTILTVLSPFHAQKTNPKFDSLLYRLYNPILWRALSATNPFVRIHASSILHVTFPLADPNADKAHGKEVISKSIELLISLLRDDDPKVRIAGCDAAIRILGVCWDLLRSDHIRSLLNEIVIKHVNDSSSAAVRAQAVKGITLLLDAPASHGVLRPLLPLVGNHIHDSVERVRLECVRMLLKLRGLKGFKYYHVVPSHHILSRLAAEGDESKKMTGPVASAISELLINSCFPKGAKGSDQMRRTLEFINQNPSASRVFYANISKHLEVNHISKLIVMLFKTIKIGVDKENRECVNNSTDGHNDSLGTEQMRVTASNTSLMQGVAETMSIVWKSVWIELLEEHNKGCLEFIQKSITMDDIVKLCAYFEDLKGRKSFSRVVCSGVEQCERICSILLSCTCYLPSGNVEALCSFVTSQIESNMDINIIPYYSALCSCGMHDQVALSLSQSIQGILDKSSKFDEAKRPITSTGDSLYTRSKRRLRSSVPGEVEEKSVLQDIPLGNDALNALGKILSGSDKNSIEIREKLSSSDICCSYIVTVLKKATVIAENMVTGRDKSCNDDDIVVILSACEMYNRFILHREASNFPIKLSVDASEYLFWLSNGIMKNLTQMDDKEDLVTNFTFEDLNLSRISAIDSRGSDVRQTLSPLAMSPSRRRSILCSSTKLDSSFASMEKIGANEFMVHTDISSTVRAHIVGISLVRSSMSVFGEWLLLGVEDGHVIVERVKEWYQVILQTNFTIDAIKELFPSLCRFLVICGKVTLQYDLMVEVLSSYSSFEGSRGGLEQLIKMTESIIATRGFNSSEIITSFVKKIADLIPTLTKTTYEQEGEDKSLDYLVAVKNYGWAVIIQTIINHGKCTPILIKQLLESFSSYDNSGGTINPYFSILRLSLQACPTGGKIGCEVRHIIHCFLKDMPSVKGCNDEKIKELFDIDVSVRDYVL